MILREFNSAGIEAFRKYLQLAKVDPAATPPRELLEDATLTVICSPEVNVEAREFGTRRDAAEYLHSLLRPFDDQYVEKSIGLWTWLTLYYFDQVSPLKNGERTVRNDYSYIFVPNSALYNYRHLLNIAWRILKIAPAHNRLFLSGSVASLDKLTDVVMKRLYLTRIPCLFEVLDRLYWDKKRGKARSGMVSPGKVRVGDLVHRFPLRIRQLEMTYDLQSLDADALIELIGDEFDYLLDGGPNGVSPTQATMNFGR